MAQTKKTNKIKKLAILASGGNAPGMNNAIIGIVKKCLSLNIKCVLVRKGYYGLVNDIFEENIDIRHLEEFTNRGNVMIESARLESFKTDKSIRLKAANNLKKRKVDGLIVLGGDGSLQGAHHLAQIGVKVMTLPCTIDNDVASTEHTIGFDTSLNQVSKIINDLWDCFSSHNGVSIVEIMGRACPDLTIMTGVGSNIDYIITSDHLIGAKEISEIVRKGKALGKKCVTIAVTEMLYGRSNLPSLDQIAKDVEKETGHMTRFSKIGYVQRGGNPSARDRAIANFMAERAVDCFVNGTYNRAMCWKNDGVVDVALDKAIKMKRKSNTIDIARRFNKIHSF